MNSNTEEDDPYDVSKYTDEQLYKILDIDNPTDRELEAKIILLIKKYDRISTPDGRRLSVFFRNIYNHFFNDEEGEDDAADINQTIVEGMENANTAATTMPTTAVTTRSDNKDKDKDKDKTKANLVTTADYVPDLLRLNPLLKQTVKRIISIDSQYRDIGNYPNASSFAFDLSEPLRDVVSLKLYSIQIPYTWYTISYSYGCNFLYLKGNMPGINNGQHDYQILIPVGNYESKTIIDAVNKGIQDISNNYPDVNFGTTNVSYNSTDSRTTFHMDIQKVYTEPYYYLKFPYWTPSNTSAIERSSSLASYLGFNQQTYYPHTIFSNQSYRSAAFIGTDNTSNYYFDESNNFFTVYYYEPYFFKGLVQEYSYLTPTPIHSFTVSLKQIGLNNDPDNPAFPLLSTSYNGKTTIETQLYTRNQVIQAVNTAIHATKLNGTPVFTSVSGLAQYDISGQNINAENRAYKLTLMLNRNAVKYVPNTKMVVIFPTETPFVGSNTTSVVWLNTPSVNNRCFYFDNSYNEFSEFVGESTVLQSNYVVGSNTYMYFRCMTPVELSSQDVSTNDIKINIPLGQYTLSSFIQQLNTSIQIDVTNNNTNGLTFFPYTNVSLKSNHFDMVVNMLKYFTEANYRISFDETSILCRYMGFPVTTNADMSITNMFTGTFPVSYSGYILDTNYILTLSPKQSSAGNESQLPVVINLIPPNGLEYASFGTYAELVSTVFNAIDQFVILNTDIQDIQHIFAASTITQSLNPSQTEVTLVMTIKVNYQLNEGNYQLEFYSDGKPITDNTNTWYAFNLNESYNLYNPELTGTTEIIGSASVSQNTINVTDVNNTIQIWPYADPLGGAYTPSNNITLTLPNGTYTLQDLYSQINSLFAENPYTTGSFIQTLNLGGNNQYAKIRLNVNRIYTTSDYNLVFYDPFSFIRCTRGSNGLQNTTWDTTLGWILGYRSYTQYTLSRANQTADPDTGNTYYKSTSSIYTIIDVSSNGILTNTVIDFRSDTTLTTTLYNYFVISLDDYNQNRINDGLVSITRSETSILAPTYISETIKVCDPPTGKVINRAVKQPDGSNLTAVEIYSLNQSVASQTNPIKTYSAGPYIKDLFGYLPIKSGPNGTYFIEYGGSLQSQERLYFGPVNIRKMSIELLNDHGQMVDLNGSNWSFSFICEQLYRGSNSGSSK